MTEHGLPHDAADDMTPAPASHDIASRAPRCQHDAACAAGRRSTQEAHAASQRADVAARDVDNIA